MGELSAGEFSPGEYSAGEFPWHTFSITSNTKLKLNGSFALKREGLVSSATGEINVSIHGICKT